ncbi:MAG: DUF4920 domain-containing protein [Saprospiraceae bacterium]
MLLRLQKKLDCAQWLCDQCLPGQGLLDAPQCPTRRHHGLFVKFKDYAFVPKDLTGSKVTVRGTAFKEITLLEGPQTLC